MECTIIFRNAFSFLLLKWQKNTLKRMQQPNIRPRDFEIHSVKRERTNRFPHVPKPRGNWTLLLSSNSVRYTKTQLVTPLRSAETRNNGRSNVNVSERRRFQRRSRCQLQLLRHRHQKIPGERPKTVTKRRRIPIRSRFSSFFRFSMVCLASQSIMALSLETIGTD